MSLPGGKVLLDDFLTLHILLMLAAWFIILPSGSTIALICVRRNRGPIPQLTSKWFQVHRLIQILGVGASAAGISMGFLFVENTDLNIEHFSKGHHLFGYVIAGLSLLQILVGCLRPNPGKQTQRRTNWFMTHRVLAVVLLLSGLINCFLGAFQVKETFQNQIIVFPLVFFEISSDNFIFVTLGVGGVSYLILVISYYIDGRNKFGGKRMMIDQNRNGPMFNSPPQQQQQQYQDDYPFQPKNIPGDLPSITDFNPMKMFPFRSSKQYQKKGSDESISMEANNPGFDMGSPVFQQESSNPMFQRPSTPEALKRKMPPIPPPPTYGGAMPDY